MNPIIGTNKKLHHSMYIDFNELMRTDMQTPILIYSIYIIIFFLKKTTCIPRRFSSSHLDCFVLMWLAHHHEYALLAALCNIFSISREMSMACNATHWRKTVRVMMVVRANKGKDGKRETQLCKMAYYGQ